jgi:hypothetical protein
LDQASDAFDERSLPRVQNLHLTTTISFWVLHIAYAHFYPNFRELNRRKANFFCPFFSSRRSGLPTRVGENDCSKDGGSLEKKVGTSLASSLDPIDDSKLDNALG